MPGVKFRVIVLPSDFVLSCYQWSAMVDDMVHFELVFLFTCPGVNFHAGLRQKLEYPVYMGTCEFTYFLDLFPHQRIDFILSSDVHDLCLFGIQVHVDILSGALFGDIHSSVDLLDPYCGFIFNRY